MKILYLIIILLTISSCKGQDRNKQTVPFKKEKSMKIFDIKTFKKKKNSANEYFFTKEDGTVIRQYQSDSDYWETIRAKDSVFEMYYEYFKNGRLKTKLKSYPDDFVIGTIKEYNEQGDLIKETDTDKPFLYSWGDVKEYLKEHGINDFTKNIIDIQRFDNPNKVYWKLEFIGEYKKLKGRFLIELDGKTGEELLVKLFKGKDSEGEVGTIAAYETIFIKKN